MKFEMYDYEQKQDTAEKTSVPPLYRVVMHNDDFTPRGFVVSILERFFFMDRQKAVDVMLEVYMQGKAVCGLFTKDVAHTKMLEVVDYARLHEHPLICSMEGA